MGKFSIHSGACARGLGSEILSECIAVETIYRDAELHNDSSGSSICRSDMVVEPKDVYQQGG